jgi:hypothetical protein
MQFNDLLREFNIPIKEDSIPKKQLLKYQIGINESFLSACDDVSKKQGIEQKIRELNKIHSQEMLRENSLITNDRRELMDLIDDLLDMIQNPYLKISKDQLIQKLKSYKQQLDILDNQ